VTVAVLLPVCRLDPRLRYLTSPYWAEATPPIDPYSHALLSTVFSYIAPGTVMFHLTVQL
jgi:hypothetical protein